MQLEVTRLALDIIRVLRPLVQRIRHDERWLACKGCGQRAASQDAGVARLMRPVTSGLDLLWGGLPEDMETAARRNFLPVQPTAHMEGSCSMELLLCSTAGALTVGADTRCGGRT